MPFVRSEGECGEVVRGGGEYGEGVRDVRRVAEA